MAHQLESPLNFSSISSLILLPQNYLVRHPNSPSLKMNLSVFWKLHKWFYNQEFLKISSFLLECVFPHNNNASLVHLGQREFLALHRIFVFTLHTQPGFHI